MLKPLQQWICDSCAEIINGPEQGYIEWQKTGMKKHAFRIVHHAPYSPRRSKDGDCYYGNNERGGDCSLRDVVGPIGLIHLTSWIDVGEWHEAKYDGPEVKDLREWTTLFRRLHVPYYEEARTYRDELRDVREGAANEIYLSLPETLRSVIEKHERALRTGA